VARAETLAEEQTEELPRRKGARPQVEEAPAPIDGEAMLDGEGVPDGELMDQAEGEAPEAGDEAEDAPFEEEAEVGDASALGIDSASPTGSTLEAGDGEGDEAEGEDLHDLALAAEESGHASHGHEVTFPPSEDDQGDIIRIATEAAELGEDAGPGSESPEEPEAPKRPAASPRGRRSAEQPTEDTTGDTP
jgi:hypothetical protein